MHNTWPHAQKNERSAGRHSSKSRFLLDTKYANHRVTKKPSTSQFFLSVRYNRIDYTNCCNQRSKRSHDNSERRNVSGVQKMRQGQNAREGEGGVRPFLRNIIRTSETVLRCDERKCETVCKLKSPLTLVFPVTTPWFRWSYIQSRFVFLLGGFRVCYLFPALFQPSLVFHITHNSLKQLNK